MADDSFKDFVLDQLSGVSDITVRKMFGAFGLYGGGVFFAIVNEGVLYFKTNENTRVKYIAAGMKYFRVSEEQALKNYFEIPADVLEDRNVLLEWAEESIDVAKK